VTAEGTYDDSIDIPGAKELWGALGLDTGKPRSAKLAVVAKEFALNRCPFQ